MTIYEPKSADSKNSRRLQFWKIFKTCRVKSPKK